MKLFIYKSKKKIFLIKFYVKRKSLVYCGALRFIKQYHNNDDLKNSKSWKFVPLDSELAQMDKNLKNPPLFVAFVKGNLIIIVLKLLHKKYALRKTKFG